MKWAFFLLVTLSILPAGTADCPEAQTDQCDDGVLKCCDSAFQTSLQFSCPNGKASYEAPDCFLNEFDPIYFNSSQGALQFCDAYNEFRYCLEPSTLSCSSFDYFVQRYPLTQAQEAVGLYKRMDFQCGAGLDSFLHNADQTMAIFAENQDQFNYCVTRFLTSSRTNPSKNCQYLKDYAGCVQFIFADLPEMSWFFCEAARAFGSVYAASCDVTCAAP
ncbi:hypothetical protein M3Y99_00851400 [Aphelenchoides fujianensis]|nr:hypothetical protein M3Y99_00851400 [Aphelenchoides fujianensis]